MQDVLMCLHPLIALLTQKIKLTLGTLLDSQMLVLWMWVIANYRMFPFLIARKLPLNDIDRWYALVSSPSLPNRFIINFFPLVQKQWNVTWEDGFDVG